MTETRTTDPATLIKLNATYRTQLRQAAVELALAREKERRAIAETLHDSVAQDLALANLKLDALVRGAPGSSTEYLEIKELVSAALTATRSLSHSLGSPLLYQLGLIPALISMFSEFTEDIDLRSEIVNECGPLDLPIETRVILYRTVRELLVNVSRHAQATGVKLSLTRSGAALVITIADDGKGFEVTEAAGTEPASQHLGLVMARERLRYLSGSLEIASDANGTSATITVPVPLTT